MIASWLIQSFKTRTAVIHNLRDMNLLAQNSSTQEEENSGQEAHFKTCRKVANLQLRL